MRPLLNVDAGELPDEPDALHEAAELLNAACGGHAGDEASMRRVAAACLRTGARLGAHPSYPDREGFGRRAVPMTPAALAASIEAQCGALRRVASEVGVPVVAAKLHGALYHDASRDPALAVACLDAIVAALGEVAIVTSASGALAAAARARGLRVWREAFADRGMREDGSLVPRGEPGALLTDPALAAAQARRLAARGDVDTVCVHGDGPTALAVARAVRAALAADAGAP